MSANIRRSKKSPLLCTAVTTIETWMKSNEIFFFLGKRACLGESLARMEFYLFAAALLQKFSFKFPADRPPPSLEPKGGVISSPHPFEIIVETRKWISRTSGVIKDLIETIVCSKSCNLEQKNVFVLILVDIWWKNANQIKTWFSQDFDWIKNFNDFIWFKNCWKQIKSRRTQEGETKVEIAADVFQWETVLETITTSQNKNQLQLFFCFLLWD